jgi:hypothetical protein
VSARNKKKGPGEVTTKRLPDQHVPDAVARPLFMKPRLHPYRSRNNVYFARPRADYGLFSYAFTIKYSSMLRMGVVGRILGAPHIWALHRGRYAAGTRSPT